MRTGLSVVCLAVGQAKGHLALSVARLQQMLKRHCPRPFQLHCYSDQPLASPPDVTLHDCSGWTELLRGGMRPTTRKLGFFHPAYVPFPEFLYLDLSLVIRSDLSELLRAADASPAPLMIVGDWHHGGYNSSVMRIRPGPLQEVYQAFVRGEQYVQRVQGDQEFIHNAVQRHGLADRVALFPEGLVCSFKAAARLCRRDAEAARALIQSAAIVKFHGRPKMDEAFGRRYLWTKIRPHELLQGHLRPVFPMASLQREWTAGA